MTKNKEKKIKEAPKTNKKEEAKKEIKSEKKSFAKKQNIFEGFEPLKAYPTAEAITWVKKLGREKFDTSIEVHFRLGIDPKKGEQQVRGAVALPHGTGKTIRIAAFVSAGNEESCKKAGADLVGGDDLVAEIKKSEKTDFQVAIAEPEMMKKLGIIAKILGTRGLMPSPKNETVTTDPAKTVAELKKGKVSFKNDDTGNIHVIIGKKSFDDQKLTENFNTLLEAIRKIKPASAKGSYIKNISLSSSMGKGVRVNIN